MAKKRVKVTVLLDSDDLKRFEAYREEGGGEKSTLIVWLTWDHFDEERFHDQRQLALREPSRRTP